MMQNFINAVTINDAPSDRNIKRQFNVAVSVLWQLCEGLLIEILLRTYFCMLL